MAHITKVLWLCASLMGANNGTSRQIKAFLYRERDTHVGAGLQRNGCVEILAWLRPKMCMDDCGDVMTVGCDTPVQVVPDHDVFGGEKVDDQEQADAV